MKLGKTVKPIDCVKADASEAQETLAMLKILALGKKEIEEGKFQPIDEAFDEVRKRLGPRG